MAAAYRRHGGPPGAKIYRIWNHDSMMGFGFMVPVRNSNDIEGTHDFNNVEDLDSWFQ